MLKIGEQRLVVGKRGVRIAPDIGQRRRGQRTIRHIVAALGAQQSDSDEAV